MFGIQSNASAGGTPGVVIHGGPSGSIIRGILGLLAGIALGVIGIAMGVLFLFLPPIGWVLAPVIVLGSLALPLLLAVYGSRSVTGRCPYCSAWVLGVPSQGSITCRTCNTAIWVKRSP